MSTKHIIKHTNNEIVFKCYITDAAGGDVDLSLQTDMTTDRQVYVAPTSIPDETGGGFATYTGSAVFITGIWWGLKKDKQLDICRILNPTGPVLHGHYYLINSGSYDFVDLHDRVYANKDIRLAFDGPGHCIIRLTKAGWAPKNEEAQFGGGDNPNEVGS